MARITADDELRESFFNFSQDVELCDEQGNIVALVRPFDPSQGTQRILLDTKLREKLLNLEGDVEIRDEAGRVLAWVLPPRDETVEWEWDAVPEITDEEIERRLNSGERKYSTAEVLEILRKL